MKTKILTAILAVFFIVSSFAQKGFTKYIDPTIGNVSRFLVPTYPTIHLPNQMIRMFPVKKDYISDQVVGWVQYFKYATGYQKLKDLDAWVRCRLRYCIWKQWKKPRRRYRAFLQLGVEKSWARRFAWSRLGGWRIACSPIMGTTVTEERLRQRGYIPFLEYYLQVKYANKKS